MIIMSSMMMVMLVIEYIIHVRVVQNFVMILSALTTAFQLQAQNGLIVRVMVVTITPIVALKIGVEMMQIMKSI